MSENKISLETLQSENYSIESTLNPHNRKTLRKMFKYIQTFPLGEYETALIQKDIAGMAQEAEQRGMTLEDSIDGSVNKFCDELVRAIGGIEIPKGRSLLYAGGTLYLIRGIYLVALFVFFGSFTFRMFLDNLDTGHNVLYLGGQAFPGGTAGFVYILLKYAVLGVISILAGRAARKYSGNQKKTKTCLRMGIVLLAVEAAAILSQIIMTREKVSAGGLAVSLVIAGILPVLLIAGARKNN